MKRGWITAGLVALAACNSESGGFSSTSGTLAPTEVAENSAGFVSNGALSCPGIFAAVRAAVPAALEVTSEQDYYPTCKAETTDSSTIVIVGLDPRPIDEIRPIVESGCDGVSAYEDCSVDDASAEFGVPAFWLRSVSYSGSAVARVWVERGPDVLLVFVESAGTDQSAVAEYARAILSSIE